MLIKEVLGDKDLINSEIELNGWVATHRLQTQLLFISLNDGSSLNNIQIVSEFTKEEKANYSELLDNLYKGVSLQITGKLIESPGKGQAVEIKATLDNITILGTIDPTSFPMAKGRLPVEYIRSFPHLRTRTNLGAMVLRIRNCCSFATHKFFNELHFLNIQTPLLTSNDCEGAGETFEVRNGSNDFFENNTFLTVSGQLHAESLALGMGRVYTFGPTFRAENSNTTRHLAEFWMVEPEICFVSLPELMILGENYIKYCIKEVLNTCQDDVEFINKFIKKGHYQVLKNIVDNPFKLMDYTEAIDILKEKKDNTIKWGDDLSTEQEKYLTEVYGPTIVYNYPKRIKSFYMKENVSHHVNNEKTVMAFDILVPTIGEIIGGSIREDNYDILKHNMEDKKIDNLDWYLDLRKYGSVPHGGFGLGFERLIMLITGVSNIRDTISYPRYPKYCFA